MKNILSILLFAFILLISPDTQSQNRERFPLLRERIAQAKLREIKLSLKLDQDKFMQFRPVYLKYEREISGVDFRKMGRLMKVDSDSLSAEEADNLIVTQMEIARRLMDIREKYYKEFRTVLTPQQIIKLYQTEAELRKKVTLELKRRLMNR